VRLAVAVALALVVVAGGLAAVTAVLAAVFAVAWEAGSPRPGSRPAARSGQAGAPGTDGRPW